MWPRDTELRRAALALYDATWPGLAGGIETARRWGSDWFEVSTPTLVREGAKLVAHVGVVTCELVVEGSARQVPALHAVCVHPEHRGRGLGRRVIEEALDTLERSGQRTAILWSEKVDLYRRFGFAPVPESAFRVRSPRGIATRAERLYLEQVDDRRLLRKVLEERAPVSHVSAAADRGWHFLIDLALGGAEAGDLLWLPEHEAIVVARRREDRLCLLDVLSRELPSVDHLVGACEGAYDARFSELELRFSPDRLDLETTIVPHPSEDVLQLRGEPLGTLAEFPFAFSPFTRT